MKEKSIWFKSIACYDKPFEEPLLCFKQKYYITQKENKELKDYKDKYEKIREVFEEKMKKIKDNRLEYSKKELF